MFTWFPALFFGPRFDIFRSASETSEKLEFFSIIKDIVVFITIFLCS